MPKPHIIKTAFLVSVIFLFLFAIARYLGNFFIDQESLDKSFAHHLPYLIIGAILLGVSYIFFFARAFPKGWENQSIGGQVAIVIIFLLLAFTILRQGSITLDILLPAARKEHLRGIVTNKEIEKTGKGTKFYHITIESFSNEGAKKFAVSKEVYLKNDVGDTLYKEIFTGYLGIKYARE